jgi:hypothetical protein
MLLCVGCGPSYKEAAELYETELKIFNELSEELQAFDFKYRNFDLKSNRDMFAENIADPNFMVEHKESMKASLAEIDSALARREHLEQEVTKQAERVQRAKEWRESLGP